MAQLTLRPGFRTAGGEVNDIEIDGKYAGTLTLAYRENDRLIGSVQLDKTMISPQEKLEVVKWTDEYVHDLADALAVEECEVLVTYARIDHIITNFDEANIEDIIDPNEQDEYTMVDEAVLKPVRLELVIVGEDVNQIEYHIYGNNRNWLAEAVFELDDTEVIGEVNWMRNPNEDEIEAAVDLIVSDFDEDAIDYFQIEMKYQGVTIESIELTHEDLLALEDQWTYNEASESLTDEGLKSSNHYSVKLIRDDKDVLTYDVFERKHGDFPIGQATIDLSDDHLTGFIEFHEATSSEDRERVAAIIMRELEKDKDYESLNLTMLHRNTPIEDIMFENEAFH